jgi:uncharacterized protein YcaQ
MATWLGLGEIDVLPRGDLSPALRAAVVGTGPLVPT